jgi:splicing factor U2AF subunit
VPNSDTAKKQRQVYVGNIPPEVDAETLNVFLSSTLSAAYPEALASGKYPNDSLIEEIKMSVDRKYCFATVVDPDMATALFAINGVDLCGYTLMIARPSGWVDPETMKEKADIAYEQMKIIQAEERAELGENLPAHLAAANNVAAASARKVEGGVVAVAGKGVEESVTTVYVQLKHIATEEDVNDDEEYEDLKLDVAAECEKFCSHSSSSSSSLALPRRGPFVGSAFAKFSDKESALKAKEGMHGRAFDGRIIEGSFASESEYEQALKDE